MNHPSRDKLCGLARANWIDAQHHHERVVQRGLRTPGVSAEIGLSPGAGCWLDGAHAHHRE